MANDELKGFQNPGFENSELPPCTSLEERNPQLYVLNPSLQSQSESPFFSKTDPGTNTDFCTVEIPSSPSSEASSSDSFRQDSPHSTDGPKSNTVGPGCPFPAWVCHGLLSSSAGLRTDHSREHRQFTKGTSVPGRSGLLRNNSQISGRNNDMQYTNPIYYDQDNENVNGVGSAEPNRDQEQDYTHTARDETNYNRSVGHRHNTEESMVSSDHGRVDTPSQTQGHNMGMSRSNSAHTMETEDVSKPACCPNKCPNSCVPVLILSIMILGAGTLTLIVVLSSPAEISKLFATEATVLMRADATFEENMADSSSATFLHYEKKFCVNVKEAVKNEMNLQSCSIARLWKGSISIESRLLIQTKKNYTGNDLELLFKKGGTQRDRHTLLGSMEIYTDSINVDIVETREISSEDTGSPSRPREFDCARNDQHYLPLEYTWPQHCGEYQLCKYGKGITHVCDTGHEYGYTKGSIQSPCHRPSNRTYCGRKRLKDLAVTTSATTLASSTEESTGTTIRTTTTLATIDCSAIDQRILDNSSTLYECPKTGNDTFFVPRHDTFPHNCHAYNTCKGGTILEPGQTYCPNGSPFILKKEPCDHEYSNQTFCVQMERAQWCRENNWTVTGEDVTASPRNEQ